MTAYPRRQSWVGRRWIQCLLPPLPGHLHCEGHRAASPGWIPSIRMPSMPQKFLPLLNYRLRGSLQPAQPPPAQTASTAIPSAAGFPRIIPHSNILSFSKPSSSHHESQTVRQPMRPQVPENQLSWGSRSMPLRNP